MIYSHLALPPVYFLRKSYFDSEKKIFYLKNSSKQKQKQKGRLTYTCTREGINQNNNKINCVKKIIRNRFNQKE